MNQVKPLILITNDDGVEAKGIKRLTEAVQDLADVIIVAPHEGNSGMSHAITTKVPIRVEKLSEIEGLTIYACTGTPVDCVKVALNKLTSRKPDLILSGINHGSNSSISVIYSGTMAGAMEGALNNVPSIGFSLLDHSEDADFSHAIKYIKQIVVETLQRGSQSNICLNVNIPIYTTQEIKGIKVCRQTKGVWAEELDHRKDPFGKDYYWLTGYLNNHEEDTKDTDEWALKNNYISVVPVHTDLTAYKVMDEIKMWNL